MQRYRTEMSLNVTQLLDTCLYAAKCFLRRGSRAYFPLTLQVLPWIREAALALNPQVRTIICSCCIP